MDQLVLDRMRSEGWGFTDVYEGKKGAWRRSRVIQRVVGDTVEMEGKLLLDYMAEIKFTEEERKGKQAHWTDRNADNECLDNVSVMRLVGEGTPGRPSTTGINLPSNSLEYQRAYREKNREKFRESSKKYQAKRRAAYMHMQTLAQQNRRALSPNHAASPELTPEEIALSEKLEKLFEIPTDPTKPPM